MIVWVKDRRCQTQTLLLVAGVVPEQCEVAGADRSVWADFDLRL